MRILSTGESVYGASVRFEHEGKTYVAKGSSRGEILDRVETAVAEGEDLGLMFDCESAETERDENKVLDEAETALPEAESDPESEPEKEFNPRD